MLHYTQWEDGKLSATNLHYLSELLQEEVFYEKYKNQKTQF